MARLGTGQPSLGGLRCCLWFIMSCGRFCRRPCEPPSLSRTALPPPLLSSWWTGSCMDLTSPENSCRSPKACTSWSLQRPSPRRWSSDKPESPSTQVGSIAWRRLVPSPPAPCSRLLDLYGRPRAPAGTGGCHLCCPSPRCPCTRLSAGTKAWRKGFQSQKQ